MSRLRFNKIINPTQAAPSDKVELFASGDTPALLRTNDGSSNIVTLTPINNYSVTSQSIGAASRTYIVGSKIAVPVSKLKIGSTFYWAFNMTKTGAGVAASTIDIAIGAAGTTGDSAIVSFAKPGGSGVIDEALCEIWATVRGPLTAACIMTGEFIMTHNLAATGHASIPVVVVNTVSSGFDATVASLMVGLCLTTGASDAITIQQVFAQAVNL